MRRMRQLDSFIASVVMLVATIGCAPTLPTQTIEPPKKWLFAKSTDSLDVDKYWWEEFGDTMLTRLVRRSLVRNRDLAAAAHNVMSARKNIKVQRAAYLPSLEVEAYAERERTQEYGKTSEYLLEPTISWELSLFGALRNTKRSALSAAKSQEWAFRGMQLSLSSEVATEYFLWREALGSMEIAQRSYELRLESAQLIDSMVHYGMSDEVARDQAWSLVYTAQSDINSYQREAEQIRMTLSTLVGDLPGSVTDGGATMAISNRIIGGVVPQLPSVGFPSELMERRWDIKKAYWAAEEAAAEFGVAHSARYPSVTITGGGGVLSTSLKNLTSGKPWYWSIAGEILQPIFKWGELKGRQEMARESYLAALMSYEQSMLTAFSEVEQALIGVESYAKQRGSAASLVNANVGVAKCVGALYDSGLNDYLNVIDAERELYESQMTLLSVVTSQYIAYVSLFKALGGGVPSL